MDATQVFLTLQKENDLITALKKMEEAAENQHYICSKLK